MLKVLQAYALFSVGVKISVTNNSNGVRQVAFATHQSTKLEENISTLFGAKFLSSLLTFGFSLNEESVQQQDAISCNSNDEEGKGEENNHEREYDDEFQESDIGNTISRPQPAEIEFKASVKGFISRVGVGVGRSDNDRQFVFCNGRPVDMPNIVKSLNEVWRRYEMKQKPAFILDLKVSAGSFDVNLAPDKREVIIQHENLIIEKLKQVVDELYSPSRHTFVVGKPTVMTSFLIQSQVADAFEEVDAVKNGEQEKDEPRNMNDTNVPRVSDFDEKDYSATISSPVKVPSAPAAFESSFSSVAEMKDHPVVWLSPLEKERYSIGDNCSQPLQKFIDFSQEKDSLETTRPSLPQLSSETPMEENSEDVDGSQGGAVEMTKQTHQFMWRNTGKAAGDGYLTYFTGRKRKLQGLYESAEDFATLDSPHDQIDDLQDEDYILQRGESSLLDQDQFKTLTKSVSGLYLLGPAF